ncbi:MAG TPA: sulfite exporter TauE/SafE family protein [Candidatus Acidoferrales bacterium]|nr:sulfite exporter TauE/SafE family protein [Candidatus Acidoferrales bacterium]
MQVLIGFVIALAVGLTGIGGGSFTVPALVLIVGLLPGSAVGTAFVFAGVLRLIAAPFYLAGRRIHWRYLWLLVIGAVPGLAIGTFVLRLLSSESGSPTVVILLGLLLTASSSLTFIPRAQYQGFAQNNSRWLPWLALPIGVEAGFSSAGAGALGTILLLNYSEMTPPEVVGTDILFGLVLAVLGSAFHWKFGSISSPVLLQLLEGGMPGVVIGCLLARHLPARRLKFVIALIAIFAGLQLVWSGARTLMTRHGAKPAAASHARTPASFSPSG